MVKLMIKLGAFIRSEYKFFILVLIILFLGLFRLPYNLYVGGGIISLDNRLTVENEKKETGSFNLSYVTTSHATIPTYLLSFITGWERESINDVKIDDNDSVKDIWKREKLYLQEANDNAIISAYHEAKEEITINKDLLKILYLDKNSDTNLEIGDILLTADNVSITDFNSLKEVINNHKVGDEISVDVLRDEEKLTRYFKINEVDGEKRAGIYLIKMYDYVTPRKTTINFSNSEGGPSGGFMVSLAIYTRLTGNDLTKGKKIAGTGTIDEKGNIGMIGGVTYKVTGAYHGKADVFLVPSGNYEEAVNFAKEKKYNLDIVKVDTLHEAIEYLESR